MNITRALCISVPLALGLAACGSNTSSEDAYTPTTTYYYDAAVTVAPDAAVPQDLVVPQADPYVWIVVQDIEQNACTTNGPGADIDAVALWGGSAALGWGKIGTASYTQNTKGYACENADCNGGNCKYAANSKTLDKKMLVAYTEGPKDAVVNAKGDDSGYFSLNAGTLQIQMGDLTGSGPARALRSGDMIKVFEVDKTYITSGDAPENCACVPEKYTVSVQTQNAGAASLQLRPTLLAADNASCLPLTAASTEGCGSTVFVIP